MKRKTNIHNLRIDTSLPIINDKVNLRAQTSIPEMNRKSSASFSIFIIFAIILTIIFTVIGVVITADIVSDEDFHLSDSEDNVIKYNSLEYDIATIPEKLNQTSVNIDLEHLKDVIVLGGEERSPLEYCLPTVQVKIYQILSSSEGDDHNVEWILQSFDKFGNEKKIGGDEFYITYTESNEAYSNENDDVQPTAVAFVHDLNSGKYKLDFVSVPVKNNVNGSVHDNVHNNVYKNGINYGNVATASTTTGSLGRIKVYFEYTCGMGSINQPMKKNWKSSGMMYQKPSYSKDNVHQPPIREFDPPNKSINLSSYSQVVFFGDSTMYQLVVKNRTPLKLFRPSTDYRRNVRSELKTDRVTQFIRKLQTFHGKQLRQSENAALVIGSSIWDLLVEENIQGNNFDDHLEACRQFIEHVRKKYSKVDLYWKGTSALHPHRVDCNEATYDYQDCLNSTKYLSNSRVQNLERRQRKLMQELEVPYLDLYPTYYLSAYQTAPGDGRHSINALNEHILSWFYSN